MGKIRHVVMFKFKPELSVDKIKYLEDKFRSLQKKIPEIIDYEWGKDMSAEGVSAGFTHLFLVTFSDFAARDRYLEHPAHVEFSDEISQLREKVLVFDYEMRS